MRIHQATQKMVERRLYLILFAFALFVSVLHAERARNDHLQDDDDEFDFNNEDRDDGRNYFYSIEIYCFMYLKRLLKPSNVS